MLDPNAMSTPKDDTLVEIPTDAIALGHDTDGLPKTIPAEQAQAPVVEEPKAPKFSEQDYERAQREAGDARTRAEAAEKAREEERQARAKAEEEAYKFRGAAVNSHHAKVQAELNHIVDSIQHWETAADAAKRNLQLATEAGNAAEVAEWTRALTRAENSLSTLNGAKPSVEAELREAVRYVDAAEKAPKPEVPKKEDAPPQKVTPDEWIAEKRKTIGAKVADWLDTNREFVTNPQYHQAFLGLANSYLARGKPLNSDAFVRALNRELLDHEDAPMATKEKEAEPVKEEPKGQPQQQQRRTVAAAPVSRGQDVFSSRNMNASQVRLPPKLAQFVKDAGLNYEKYAIETVKKIKNGELPSNFLDPDYPHQL